MVIILAFVAIIAVVVAIVALRRSGQPRTDHMPAAASIWGSRPVSSRPVSTLNPAYSGMPPPVPAAVLPYPVYVGTTPPRKPAVLPNPEYVDTAPPATAAVLPNPVYVGTTPPGRPAVLPNPMYVGTTPPGRPAVLPNPVYVDTAPPATAATSPNLMYVGPDTAVDTAPPATAAMSPNLVYVGPDNAGGGVVPSGNFTVVSDLASPAAYGSVSSNQPGPSALAPAPLDPNDDYAVLVREPAASDGIYEVLRPMPGDQQDSRLSATDATYASIYDVNQLVVLPVYKTAPGHAQEPHMYEYDISTTTPEDEMTYAVASDAPKAGGGENSHPEAEGDNHQPAVLPIYKTAPEGHAQEYNTSTITPESKMPYAVASAAPKAGGGENSHPEAEGDNHQPAVLPVYKTASDKHTKEYNTSTITPESKMPYAVASAAPKAAHEDPDATYEVLVDDDDRYSNPTPDAKYANGQHGVSEVRGNGAYEDPDAMCDI